jgi:hypothetical protein
MGILPSRRGTVKIRHATPVRNINSILNRGLLCAKSKGRLKAVWLHAPLKTYWAVVHVAERHHARVEQVAVLELQVPRRWLRRSRRGLWYCPVDVPPSHIHGVVTFHELARVAC